MKYIRRKEENRNKNKMSLSKPKIDYTTCGLINPKIDYKTTCQWTTLSDKRKSNFHTVTINIKKDLGGVLDIEVIDVWQQVLEDYKSGLIIAATMGIELVNESRHLHISLILAIPTLGSVTQKRYEKLIAPGRLDAPKISLRGDKEIRTPVTVQVEQPKTKNMENYRAYRWLSYAHKERAKDFNDVLTFNRDVDWRATREFKTIGLFGGPNDAHSKSEFGNFVFTSWQKKLTKRIGAPETVWLNNNLSEQARRFMEKTGLDMEWIDDDLKTMATNQAVIITKMVLNKIGKERYHLSKNFFGKGAKNKAISDMLCSMRPPSNRTCSRYEQSMYDAIEKRMIEVLCFAHTTPRRSKADATLLKTLTRENVSLNKMNVKLKNICKEHVAEKLSKKNFDKRIAFHSKELERLRPGKRVNNLNAKEDKAFYMHRDAVVKLREQQLSLMQVVDMQIGTIVDAVLLADANKIDALFTLDTIVHKIEEEEHIPVTTLKRPLTISVQDQERNKRLKAIEGRSQKK